MLLRVLLLLTFVSFAQAETTRVCTQNLYNFGQKFRPRNGQAFDAKKHEKRVRRQEQYLVERITQARCDIIAVQEVIGETKAEARRTLSRLGSALKQVNGDSYSAYVGDTRDRRIRNGFLVKERSGTVRSVTSYANHFLPKLSLGGQGASFSRGPLVLEFETHGHTLLVFSVHFKSKFESWKDPTKTKYESLRVEMAAGVRDIVRLERRKHQSKNPVLLIAGDLNSDRDSATARVLSGELSLDDFRGDCRISRKLRAYCGEKKFREGSFTRLFDLWIKQNPQTAEQYSYKYKGRGSLIDEMLLSFEHLKLIQQKDDSLSLAMFGRLRKGSDHKLLVAELDWKRLD